VRESTREVVALADVDALTTSSAKLEAMKPRCSRHSREGPPQSATFPTFPTNLPFSSTVSADPIIPTCVREVGKVGAVMACYIASRIAFRFS
jgi:hypothetical protein